MKKILLLTSLLLALTVSVALAGGVNIAWGTICYGENPVNAITFACNSNSTTYNKTIVNSFMLDDAIAEMIAAEWTIKLSSDTGTLPEWWKFQTGGCRVGKATASSGINGVGDVCVDWVPDGITKFDVPNNVQIGQIGEIRLGYAIADIEPALAVADQEYTCGGVVIANSKTVGTPKCDGCLPGLKLGLDYVKAVGNGGVNVVLTTPMLDGNQCLSWNNSIQECVAPVPARNTTWGQVKSLYR